jgi:hypothetical protein
MKDHGVTSNAILESRAIVLSEQQFAGIPFLLVSRTVGGCSPVSSGYGYARADYNTPGVVTSLGAEALYGGNGRMLADNYPGTVLGSTAIRSHARSKDHIWAGSGDTCASATALEARTGTPGPP